MFAHKVELLHCSAIEGVTHKDELVQSGLYLNVDFIWHYKPAQYDNDGFSAVTPKTVEFYFRDAATATFYQLKWL